MTANPERRFDDAVNAGFDVFYALDREWRVVVFNDEAERYFGFPRDQVLGKVLWDIFPQARGTPFGAAFERAMGTREKTTLEAVSVIKPGKRIMLSVAPWDDGVCVVIRDITMQSNAQRQLEANEERLRLATDAATIGTWDFNPINGRLRWDERCKALFGLPPDAEVAYDTSFLAGLHPDDRDRVDAAVQAALAPEGTPEYDIEYRTIGLTDGVERFIAAKGRAIFQDGKAVRFIGTVLDITKRKRAERVIEIVKHTGAAIVAELDLQKIVQTVTDAGVELSGAQFGAFFYNVTNDRGESYMLYTLSGAPRSAFEKFPMPRNTEVFAPTFSGASVVRSGDIKKDPRYGKNAPREGMPEGHLPVTSYLAVPVISRSGEVLGGLFFGHKDADRFDAECEALVTAVANQAAVAIDNARLFATARDAQAKLATINESLEARVIEEVAARVSAEQGAHATSEQFRLLVQGVVDYAIYLLDLEGHVITWNSGAERIKGYTADEVVGKHLSMFYTVEDRVAREPWRLLDEARQLGRTEMEGWRVRKDGSTFWASVVIDAVRDRSGTLIGFAKITRDITAQRQAARDLEVAREALFQSQKMESIGQLTGGLAHDFNNLLTAVLGNLSLMQKVLPPSEQRMHRLLDGAVQGANRGAALTQRLLAFSRRHSLQVTPTDVVKLVSGMKALLERSIGPAIRLAFDIKISEAIALIDANQVELALLNLAVNARDAMPDGGELRIGVERTKGLPKGTSSGAFIVISVTDTGVGMNAETLQRAIDPFFSTKELGKGTGLGLSMVHGLAVQQQGAFHLSSTVGRGTRAELYLPATQLAPFARQEASPDAAPNARRSRILLVDDDSLIAMSSVDMLTDLGHEVLEAHSGRQALEILEKTDAVDLLITDFAMPGMTGAQLIEAARSRFPELPILLATGYAELPSGNVNDIPRIGKPFTQAQLAKEVAKLLNS